MHTTQKLELTTYDRILMTWEDSKELVRDFESYSKIVDEPEVAEIFAKFAEDEGHHAAKLLELAHKYSPRHLYVILIPFHFHILRCAIYVNILMKNTRYK